jgi:hypothetical protein
MVDEESDKKYSRVDRMIGIDVSFLLSVKLVLVIDNSVSGKSTTSLWY